MSNDFNEAEATPEFDQSKLYAAIKELLFRKGYLNEDEKDEDAVWSLRHQSSWSAYAANVHGVNNVVMPWNEQSIPEWLMTDLTNMDGYTPPESEAEPETEEDLPEGEGGDSNETEPPSESSTGGEGGDLEFNVNRDGS